MTDKVVVMVEIRNGRASVTPKGGARQDLPISEKLRRKMNGLTTAYFFAKPCPIQVYNVDRLAPFSSWIG